MPQTGSRRAGVLAVVKPRPGLSTAKCGRLCGIPLRGIRRTAGLMCPSVAFPLLGAAELVCSPHKCCGRYSRRRKSTQFVHFRY